MEWTVRVHFFLYVYLTVRGLCCVRWSTDMEVLVNWYDVRTEI